MEDFLLLSKKKFFSIWKKIVRFLENLFLFIVIHDVMAKCVTATTFDHPLDDTLGIKNQKKVQFREILYT